MKIEIQGFVAADKDTNIFFYDTEEEPVKDAEQWKCENPKGIIHLNSMAQYAELKDIVRWDDKNPRKMKVTLNIE